MGLIGGGNLRTARPPVWATPSRPHRDPLLYIASVEDGATAQAYGGSEEPMSMTKPTK